jgi:hypothetical protein
MEAVRRTLFTFLGKLNMGKTPEVNEEAQKFVDSLQMTKKELRLIYTRFTVLRAWSPSHVPLRAKELATESLDFLVTDNRGLGVNWVRPILRNVVQLAGAGQALVWDDFLYMILRFCSLSKIELCQLMYFVIIKEVKSWTVDYLTCTQLAEYYEKYNDCPIEGFSCAAIHFYRLARNRYDLPSFVELCHRFHQLINPLLFLQREVRQACPYLSFWEDFNRVPYRTRRIDLDFFSVKKSYLAAANDLAKKKKEEGGFEMGLVKDTGKKKKKVDPALAGVKGLDRVALGARWEPTGAGTGRSKPVTNSFAADPLQRMRAELQKKSSMVQTSAGWVEAQDAVWLHQFIPRDYDKPLTEKNQEVDFIKASRERGRKPEGAISALERNHQAPILKRPIRKGPRL